MDYRPGVGEVEEHLRSGHVPYRSWCTHCIHGGGGDTAQCRGKGEESEIPVVSMNYCYLCENMEQREERKKEEAEGSSRDLMEMQLFVVKYRKSNQVMAELEPIKKGLTSLQLKEGNY